MATITGQTPAPNANILPTTELRFHVGGIGGAFAIGLYYATGEYEIAWDGATFSPFFKLDSRINPSVPEITTDCDFALRRTGGWRTAPTVVVTTPIFVPGGGDSGDGQINVATWADLLAFDMTLLPSGSVAFVGTTKCFYVYDRNSAVTPDPGAIGNATGGGQWIFKEPSPYWISAYAHPDDAHPYRGFISDAGGFEASGLDDTHPIPAVEMQRRLKIQWPESTSISIKAVDDFNWALVDLSSMRAANSNSLLIYADPKRKILDNVAITEVTTASYTNPTSASISVVWAAAGKTATRSSGSWRNDGLVIGQRVRAPASASNTGTYTITAITALVLTFGGDTIANETVSTTVVGLGGTDGTITIAGDFALSVGKIGRINSGPRDGVTFGIFKDFGSGQARIGNAGAGAFDSTQVTLQVGDTFDTWDLVTQTGEMQITGPGDLGGFSFMNIACAGNVNLGDNALVFFDACTIAGEASIYTGAQLQFSNCLIGSVDLYLGGLTYLFGGGCFGAVACDGNGVAAFERFTMQGGRISFTDNVEAEAFIEIGAGWLASYDRTINECLAIAPSCVFKGGIGSPWFGRGLNMSTAKISLSPGAKAFYDVVPNLDGTAVDISQVGTSRSFAELPLPIDGSGSCYVDTNEGAPGFDLGREWARSVPYTTPASATPTSVAGLTYPLANSRGYLVTIEAQLRGASANKTAWGGQTATMQVSNVGVITIQNSGSIPVQDPRSAGDATLSAFVVDYDVSVPNQIGIALTPLAGQQVFGIYTLRVLPGP